MSFNEFFGAFILYTLVVFFILKILRFIWVSFLGSNLGYGYNFDHSDDAFAIVTGATDGIGLEYAKYFAKKGYRLLLISRNLQRLNDVKQSIEEQYKTCKEIIVHEADFSKCDIYEDIKKTINKLPKVEILVNNVGISYQYAEYLTKIPESWETIDSLLKINIFSCTKMTQIVLPIMETQKKGLILNISSLSATYPSPLLSVYGASKCYVDHLSRALNLEYSSSNIVIQSVLPAFVSSKMSKIRKTSLLVPSPKTYIESQMRTVGFENRTYGYWPHKVQGFILDSIIFNLLGSDFISKIVFHSLKNIRSQAYKKFGFNKD